MKIKLLLAAALTLLPGFADTATLQWDAAPMVDPASGQRGGGGDAVFGLIFQPFSEKLDGALYPMVLPTAASMSLQMGPRTLVCSAQQNSDLGQWLAVICCSPVGTAPSPPALLLRRTDHDVRARGSGGHKPWCAVAGLGG